ncbi:MAG TPA: cobalamin-binding protein [Candidatus Acidoferrales bacterium]|jgi:iron complex transport system substrate-binding protein|nr:cobalamin-binding protein [Candidatus Acidoferrales bacterium]
MICGKAALGRAVAFAALAALAAGGQTPPQGVNPPPGSPATSGVEVTDEAGRRVRVPQPVHRIVSLAPSLTETIYALGAQDKLIGVTDYCDYPPEALAKPKIGGIINPSLERIAALKPDLVLVTKSINRLETVKALEGLGIAVYATDPHSVEEVLASTALLGELLGAGEAGKALVAGLRARLAELRRLLDARPPRRVLFVVWRDPLISVGRETYLGDALRRAGAESIVESSQAWPHVSLEEVVRRQPDYLVFASAAPEESERDFEALRERPGWRNLEAVRLRRVVVVSDAINHPSPRLVDAIFQLARELHSKAFEEKPKNGKPTTEEGKEPRTGSQFPHSDFDFPGVRRREPIPCGR